VLPAGFPVRGAILQLIGGYLVRHAALASRPAPEREDGEDGENGGWGVRQRLPSDLFDEEHGEWPERTTTWKQEKRKMKVI
jgi:hypothetical protein